MPYCPNCGEEVDEDMEFCGNCGTSLEGESSGTQMDSSGRRSGKTSMDMEENLEGALCYVLGPVTGLLFYVLEERSNFVRFHAMQSIVTFLPLMILWWLLGWIGGPTIGYGYYSPGIPALVYLSWAIGLGTILLALIMIFKAYQGEKYKLPVAGDIAENQV